MPPPTFLTQADVRTVRVYETAQPAQPAPPDDDLDEEADSDIEEQFHLNQTDDERLARNEEYLRNQLGEWTLSDGGGVTRSGIPIQNVHSPTLSKISHFCMHPMLYTGIQPISTLHRFAEGVGTEPNWEEIYRARVAGDHHVNAEFHRMRVAVNHEPDIQFIFSNLVSSIARAAGREVYPRSEKRIGVGGMLVREHLNVFGKTDPYFQNEFGRSVLASEVKTDQAFPMGTFWHRGFRGPQVLGTLYGHDCPTLLFSQRHFKIFWESILRDMVFTYPADQDREQSQFLNASLTAPMGRDFLKVILICLLSPRSICAQEPGLADVAVRSPLKTPKVRKPLSRLKNSAKRPRIQHKKTSECEGASEQKANPPLKAVTPKFISGLRDGQPVYTEIRVASDEDADRTWRRICAMDKAGGGALVDQAVLSPGQENEQR